MKGKNIMPKNSLKVLVIGGAGFIGSHLADLCQSQGYETFIYDNFSTGKREFLNHIPEENILKGDILDTDFLSKIIGEINPDVVFHLAAIHHIPTCEKEPVKALKTNIEGTMSILSSISLTKKIVFASTGALYDPANTGFLSENSPLRPTDIYSISKMTCENILKYYANKTGKKIISARLFNTVGRRETNRHLIPDIVDQLKAGKREIRLGNLTPLRDYVHVEDVAEALLQLGKLDSKAEYDVFNVGTGIEHSVVDLVNLFSEVIGEKINVISVPELQRRIDRPTQKADTTKLKKATGWEPKKSLKQALEDVWIESKKGK